MDLAADLVVLLDEDRRRVGTASRTEVHDARTPLHLAFSCYLIDRAGRVLLTRRAVTKRTWPGVWTNSFCGHPRPDEPMEAALERRAREELGVTVADVRCVLPDFRYRAVDPSGVVENEVCPVFMATWTGDAADLAPDPGEVAEWRWISAHDLDAAVRAAPWALSPWLLEQHEQLRRLDDWPAGVR